MVAELAVGPFHAVSWATEALDGLRREAWREARSRPREGHGPGRPRKGEEAPADPARQVKGLRFPLLKNPEDLTEGQVPALGGGERGVHPHEPAKPFIFLFVIKHQAEAMRLGTLLCLARESAGS